MEPAHGNLTKFLEGLLDFSGGRPFLMDDSVKIFESVLLSGQVNMVLYFRFAE